jgi:hypothetical protein
MGRKEHKMKVKELVEWLQEQDQELDVMRESWELGDLFPLTTPVVLTAVKIDVEGKMVWKRMEECMKYEPVEDNYIVAII